MTDGIYLLLGSNLGDKRDTLFQATRQIDAEIGKVMKCSSLYETEPWGNSSQPSFLNQVVLINCKLSPMQLLTALLEIEKRLGRIRYEKWGERTLDIDILYYNNVIIDSDHLRIPHPEITNRRFTLVPLVELAPDFIHPVLNKTNRLLLSLCKDNLKVNEVKT